MAVSRRASGRDRNRIAHSPGMPLTRCGIVKATAALGLAAVCMLTGPDTRAENECGPHEAGVEIVCSSSMPTATTRDSRRAASSLTARR